MRISKNPEIRRAELVAAARELFDQNGIPGTQVSQIVKKVGVAQGLFYYYFKSKDEIVDEVVRVVIGEVEQEAQRIQQDAAASFCGKLRAYMQLYLRLADQFSGDEEQDLTALFDSLGQNPIARKAHELLLGHLDALIRQGCEEGVLQLRYPAETLRMIVYGLMGLSRRRLLAPGQVNALVEQGLGLAPHSLDCTETGGKEV